LRLKKFNVKGIKIDWGPYVAVLRETFGVGLLGLDGKYVVKGGLTRFRDVSWSGHKLGAVSKRKLLIIDTSQGLERLEESVVHLEGGRSVLGIDGGFVVGTEDGKLLFVKDGKVDKEVRVAEDLPIVRLERTESGSILVVAGRYTLIIVNPQGEVLAHQSYRWDLERVRWSPDLNWLAVLGDKKIEFLKYESSQGYVKVYEMGGEGVDAKWCGEGFCIATKDKVMIYKKFDVGARPRLVYTFASRTCSWAPECKGVGMCGKILVLLTFD